LTDFLANLSRAVPCDLKIFTLALSKSFRSMPSLRGIAPTNKATSTSLKAVSSLSVGTTPQKIINSNYFLFITKEKIDFTFN
jgi:hypothetical protein